jgi:hypothetical protein
MVRRFFTAFFLRIDSNSFLDLLFILVPVFLGSPSCHAEVETKAEARPPGSGQATRLITEYLP